jgi:hypothetical protein
MPVHRHQHARIGSVYAFIAELDAWSQGRRLRLEEGEEERCAEPPADEEVGAQPTATSRTRFLLVVGAPNDVGIDFFGFGDELLGSHAGT